MNPQRTPDRGRLQPIPPNTHSHPNELSPQAAALRGASLAFLQSGGGGGGGGPVKRPDSPQQQQPAGGPAAPRSNGALLAATSAAASREHSIARRPSDLPRKGSSAAMSRQTTGGSSVQGPADHTVLGQQLSLFLSSPASARAASPYLLSPPGGGGAGASGAGARPVPNTRNASFIAATLAASRSASRSPSPGPGPRSMTAAPPSPYGKGAAKDAVVRQRTQRSRTNSVASSSASVDLPDTSSIAPTTSLISMFEDKKGGHGAARTGDASPGRRLGAGPKLRPLTPPGGSGTGSGQVDLEPKKVAPKPKPRPKPEPEPEPEPREDARAATPPTRIIMRAATEIVSPKPERVAEKPRLRPPTPPPARSAAGASKARPLPRGAGPGPAPSPRAVSASKAPGSRVAPLELPTPSKPLKRDAPSSRLSTGVSASSDDTFVSASSIPSPRPMSPIQSGRESQATPRPTTPKPRRPPPVRHTTTPSPPRVPLRRNLTGSSMGSLPVDSLASAIMAGSLASARHVPASRTPPPPPAPPRHSPRRTGKMLHTLRQPPPLPDDEEAARHHHHHHHPHPKTLIVGGKKHAHHEGARHRWREAVTERERRRYEAVWASNRGLFLPDRDADYVASVVVRDLWSRSRLPVDELVEVWDLVDREGRGVLSKQEFVVGTWLIDQRLRGRKIPTRVTDSVWESVKGVRVRRPEGKGRGR